jgi:hypothetical protein
VGLVGTIVNNGHVIADGFDYLRSLQFNAFTKVTNTIENPVHGTNGWYAYRGGRITLPPVRVRAGDGTYTWGESETDPVIDLVNSIRFTVKGQAEPADVTISLRTIAFAQPLDVPLPTGVSVFGLWEFTSPQLEPDSMSFTVRYSADAAGMFWRGEEAVHLIGYTDRGWEQAFNGWLDLSNRLVGGDFAGAVAYLAVASEQNLYAISRSFEPTPGGAPTSIVWHDVAMTAQALVPEPAVLVSLAWVFVFPRRRRPIPALER